MATCGFQKTQGDEEVSSGGMAVICGGGWRFSGVSSRKLSWKVVGLDMFVICYLFCGWCFGGLFYRMSTYFNKVKKCWHQICNGTKLVHGTKREHF